MAGFTIQLDVSQLVSGAQKGQQGIASLGREFRLVAKDAGELAKATQGAGQRAVQAGNNFSQLSNRIGEYAKRIAVLYGAYRTLDAVLGTVRRGLDFSASLESSEIAIASVIAATNKLSDSTGKQLEGVEKFNAAQELSKDIMDEIQVLALQTTATFDSLADGVAGIVAPATKFGVSMEKLPSFAVKAAQAMTTMKVPVQQMRTEIEALLSGNINRAQDILATNLGITGEMVRNWQQQGVLVEELEKRLEAFAIAGDRVADSWSGLRGNMEDALNYLSGKTGRGIFEGAKQAYRELLDLMVSTEGKIGVGKDVENLVELLTDVQNAIGQELVDATRGFIELIRELNEPESVDKIRRTFVATAETVRGVATGLSDMKEGVVALVEMLGADPTVTAAGGLVGYKLFGPKGLLLGLISDVVLKGLEQLGKFFAFIQDKAGFGNIDLSTMPDPEKATPEELREWRESNIGLQAEQINKAVKEAEEAGKKIAKAFQSGIEDNKKENITISPSITGNKYTDDQIKSAKEKIAQLRFEIEKMNGEAASNTLEQKLKQIDEAAKIAGVNAGKLKEEYIAAFKADTLEDFDRALLKAQGNTREITALNIAEQAEQWKLKLQEAGLSAEEATAKAQQLAEALAGTAKKQELSEQASILKEIGELTGDVSMATSAQIQLIEAQAEAYKTRLNPELHHFIDQWLELKKLQLSREGWAGAYRATQDYFDSATNMAQGFYNLTTNAFQGMEDAIVTACQTGKLSFSDMINSMISDLIRLMVRQSITGPLASALTQGIGSLFGGGGGSFFSLGGSSGGGGIGSSLELSNDFTSNIGNLAAGKLFHSGGIVGVDSGSGTRALPYSVIEAAPRFHSGKLPWNPATEVPAVIRRDEGVFTPEQMKALGRGGDVQVNIINSTGQQATTRTRSDNYGNKTIDVYVGDMAAKQMATPGSTLNRAVSAQTGTKRPAIRR